MRGAAVLLVLGFGAVAHAQERAFVETVVDHDAGWVNQPVRVTLRIGFDAKYFAAHAVQMFRRELDVPLQVDAPWFDALPGTVTVPARRPSTAPRLSVALNGRVVGATRGAEQPPFTVLEIVRTFVPTEPGVLALAAPRLRYVHATEFREDFVNGRVAVDRNDAVVSGAARSVRVAALPAAGRPPDFTGAVGRFTVSAEASPTEVEAGAVLELALHVEGEGNLTLFDTPRLDGLAGFHVYGMRDDHAAPRRTIRYDVAPLRSDVASIPSVPFVWFDTESGGYRVARTEPLPLVVHPRPGEASAADAEEPAPVPPRRNDLAVVLALVVLAGLVALALVLRARRRRDAAVDEAHAAATFRALAARPDADLSAVFGVYLAAHLHCAPAAVIAPDLAERLTASGVPPDLAARAARLLETLVAARYGGAAAAEETAAEARAVVDALEPWFPAHRHA